MSNEHPIESEWLDIVLKPEDAVDTDLQVPPSMRDFAARPEIEKRNIEIRIGHRPIARSLRQLYELSKREVPPDFEVFKSYKLWLIMHTVSVSKDTGSKDVRRLSYEVKLPEEPRITVVEVLPQSRFIERLKIDTKNEFGFGANIAINGEAGVPDVITDMLNQTEIISGSGKVGAELRLSTKTDIIGRLSFSVVTPVIEAIGVGDYYTHWAFVRDQVPLIGDQLMAQVLLVPKSVRKLKFEARVSATITTFNFLPEKRKSQWIDLSVDLPRDIN